MDKRLFQPWSMLIMTLLIGFLAACGNGGSDSGSSGTLTTSLTDATTDEYQAVYITIDRVEVHPGTEPGAEDGHWVTVAEPGKTYNLLELVNGARETLGVAALDAGIYTQMRLIIGSTPDTGLNIFSQHHQHANYVIDQADDEIHQLTVPSGPQTGLKIVNGFEISPDQTTELILDFDAMRSVVKAGASGKYLLKPTVKVLATAEYALISGTVTDTATPAAAQAGSLVTAQRLDSSPADPKDAAAIEAGTVTDDAGEYLLFLMPADYKLVATKAGYRAACFSRELVAGKIAVVDPALEVEPEPPGTVSGRLTLEEASDDQYATIDFRREIACLSEEEEETRELVTVKRINIADGGVYAVELPAGAYRMVVWSDGMTTATYEITVTADTDAPQDIVLSPTP